MIAASDLRMERFKGRFVKPGKRARLEQFAELNKRRKLDCTEEDERCSDTAISDETSSSDSATEGWKDGRRIVELYYLAEQLRKCKNVDCSLPLLLHDVHKETRVGYASILYITCQCGMLNTITTGKSHRPANKSNKGMPVYDINTKAVLGKFFSFFINTRT